MREQIEWESARDAYRHWRESLQEQDILVFQLRFPRNELQGFSLFHLTRPVIVVNEIDGVEARIFTLFHERAHLMLREPGLCLPQKVATSVGSSVEPFCNRFAASFLIPELEAQSWKADTSTVEALEAWIRRAAARYHVSKYVILIRLKSIERISQDSFSRLYKKWDRGKTDQQNTLRPREKRQGGGPSAGQVCLRQRGKAFISLVFDAANRGLVTTRDAAMFLGVKPKDLNRLEPKA
jgi:Zn-dependent peptidase ImmA (M78 family)